MDIKNISMVLFAVSLAVTGALFAEDDTGEAEDVEIPAGGIYRTTDAEGNVIFTDKPPESGDAEEVRIRDGNIVPGGTPRRAAPRRGAGADNQEPFRYQTLRISSPAHEQTFHNPYEPIPVSVELFPSLRREHSLVLLKDGEVQPEMALDAQIYRGAHELVIEVREGDEVFQRSEPVTIFVHRASRLRP